MTTSNDISAILAQARQSLLVLEQTLQDEAQELVAHTRNPQAISAIAQRKQQLVVGINELVRTGDRWLLSQGLAVGREGVEAWLQRCPATHPSRQVWQSIMDLSARCKQMNETNGVKIGLLSRRSQEALGVLFQGLGVNEGYGPDTYGPKGIGRISSPFQTSYKA